MKRRLFVGIAMLCLVTLVGCSEEGQNTIEKIILENSGILEDTDYLSYQTIPEGTDERELLDEIENSEQSNGDVTEEKGNVHVTFGTNSNIQIEYYYDSLFTKLVDVSNCYLNPNDTLYANVIKCTSSYENLYEFSGYRIVEYDEQGNKLNELDWYNGNTDYVFQIPMEFKGTEISVIPVGKYENCTIKLCDYIINDDGEMSELAGTWCVNDEEIANNETTVSPVGGLSVKYKYDESKYFFVSSVPVCYSASDENGEVSFDGAEIIENNMSYTIELHPYITAKIVFDEKVSGSYIIMDSENNISGDEVLISKGKELNIEKLKFGDSIVITTDKKCDITTECNQVSEPTVEKVSGEYRYTLKVSSEHMPNLMLVLDESVGTDAMFSVVTADMAKNDMQYIDKMFKSDMVVVDQVISLRDGIQISINESLLGEQEAFRFEIIKIDNQERELKDTQYIAYGSQTETVEVLKNVDLTNTYYSSIKVLISRIEAYTYKEKTISNGTITLKASDNGQEILDGTVVDGSRRVIVTIKPNDGYYVDGDKNISGDSFVKEMTFSDYMKKISEVVEDNPIKKYINVTLDENDSYGTCIYTVDGNVASGTVKLKQEQKLVLEYKITDNDYQIEYNSEGLNCFTNVFKNKKETEIVIELSGKIDGKTISRDDYITIKKAD